MRRAGLAGLALALLLGGASADEKKTDRAKARAVRKEWKRLNGTWEVTAVVSDGKEVTLPEEKTTVTLRDGKYAGAAGGRVVAQGTDEIDPTSSPKSMDITPATGEYSGKTYPAIYEVKGDTYRVCIAPPDKPRPRAFESEEGSGHTLITYKRLTPKD